MTSKIQTGFAAKLLSLLILSMLMMGCGKKGDVKPPKASDHNILVFEGQ